MTATSRIPPGRISLTQSYRVTDDVCVLDEVHTHPLDTQVYGTAVAGAGSVAHDAADSAYVVGVSTASGDSALLRTHARPRANARRGLTTVLVGKAVVAPLNQTLRWGRFTEQDGVFFELTGDGLFAVRRIAGVEVRTPRSGWSIAEQRATLIDTTAPHAYEIREAWPNGDTQLFVDGVLMHAISGVAKYRSPRLPLSVQAVSASTATIAGAFRLHSAAVFVESAPEADRTFADSASATGITTGTPLLSLRPAALSAGNTNDAEVAFDTLTVSCSGEANIRLVRGATITGSWVQAAGSLAEVSHPSVITGGTIIASYVVQSGLALFANDSVFRALRVLADGSQDSLSVVVLSATGAQISARADLVWKETR